MGWKYGVRVPTGVTDLYHFHRRGPTLRRIHSPIHWVTGALAPGVRLTPYFHIVSIFRRVWKISKSDSQLCHVFLFFCLSVRPCVRPSVRLSVYPSAWDTSVPTGRIFYTISRLRVFRKSVERIQVLLKSDKTNGKFIHQVHEDLCTFMIISRRILLTVRNVSDKSCRENQNTHFMFNNVFPKIVPFMR
jgi:hypothetical protein